MATLPAASSTLDQSGGAVGGSSTDVICVMGPSRLGTNGAARFFLRIQDELDTFGESEAAEFAGRLVKRTRKPYLRIKLATAVAGSIGPVDLTGITGTAVGSFASASSGPYDDEELKYEFLTGGVLGTAGIEFRYSRDDGRTWSGKIRLGTALTHTITGVGVTYTIGSAAQTIVAGDVAKAKCKAPMYDAAGLAAGFDALKAHSIKPRVIILMGECASASEVQACIDEIDAYETEAGRHSVVLTALRDIYPDAKMQGAPADVDFDGTAHTITRGTGSWVTDGFKVGMNVTVDGSADNDGDLGVLTTVTATVLTFGSGLTTEANVDGADLTITGSESLSTWATALEAIVGASVPTQKVNEAVVAFGGRGMFASAVDAQKSQKRRPSIWQLAIREMEHDIHISPAQVDLGALDGVTIVDANGELQEYDERVSGLLLRSRIGCLRTFNDKPGVFIALPVTLDEDGKTLSRLPVVLVGQLACTVAQRGFTERLNSSVLKKPDGTIQEGAARRIEEGVREDLKVALLQSGREGQRASSIESVTLSRDVVLTPGAEVPWLVEIVALGYLEQLPGTVRIS